MAILVLPGHALYYLLSDSGNSEPVMGRLIY